jgi:hypothetical protein
MGRVSRTALIVASTILPPDSLTTTRSPTLCLGIVAAVYNTQCRLFPKTLQTAGVLSTSSSSLWTSPARSVISAFCAALAGSKWFRTTCPRISLLPSVPPSRLSVKRIIRRWRAGCVRRGVSGVHEAVQGIVILLNLYPFRICSEFLFRLS